MNFPPEVPPRLRSSLPAVDIGGFFEAVNDALKLHLQTEAWPAGTKPTFVHDFPKERIAKADDPFDLITFHVGGATMAPTSNDGNRVPPAPALREEKASTTYLGYNTKTLAWKEMVEVVFTIWSKSNKRADDMTSWFHSFLMQYAFGYRFFYARGVDWFRFLGRKEDEMMKIVEGQELYVRTLVYQIRIEYLQTLLEKQFDNLTFNIAVDRQTDTIERP